MRKLYTNVSLDPSSAFMVTYNDVQTQACANDEDTVTIGATEFIRLTDENGHNVSDGEGNQLLLNDGVIYKVVSGVPESTNVQVTDVTPEPPVVRHTYTYYLNNGETASFTCSDEGATITSNAVTAAEGATITFSFSKTGYQTLSGTTTMGSSDEYVNIVLVEEGYIPAWTYVVSPEEPIVEETVYTIDYPPQLGDSVHDGSFTQIDEVGEMETTAGIVTAIKLSEDAGDWIYDRNPSSDMPNPWIPTQYTYTVNPIPADATVELQGSQGGTQSGNSITGLQYDETVSYEMSRIGYLTTQGTTSGITSDTNETLPVNAYRFTPENYYGDDNAFWYRPSDLQSGLTLFYQNEFGSLRVTPDEGGAFIGININNPEFGTFTDGSETYYPLIVYDSEEMQPLGYVCMGDPDDESYNMPLCATAVNGDTLAELYVWDIDNENMSGIGLIQFLPIQ